MKLIKLTDTHYIVVDDSKKGKEGWNYNFVINKLDKLSRNYADFSTEWQYCKKITHSTQPLEGVEFISLSEVEEAIYVYSVEKMAYNQLGNNLAPSIGSHEAYIRGFNAHKELVKDKLFTIDDIRNAFKAGQKYGEDNACNAEIDLNNNIIQYVVSLLPKNEWEVEFNKNNKLKLI